MKSAASWVADLFDREKYNIQVATSSQISKSTNGTADEDEETTDQIVRMIEKTAVISTAGFQESSDEEVEADTATLIPQEKRTRRKREKVLA